MDPVKPKLDDLATQDRRRVESLLIDFDQRWRPEALEGRIRDIPPDSSWRLPLLVEMVKIDLEKQWAAGNRISLEEYLGIYPELGNPGDVSADLILAEYEVRKQFGAGAALEDYLARFPHKAADLARMIAAGTSSRFRRSPDGALQPASDPGLPRAEAEELSLRESQQFGRYVIGKRLGRGGMGSVYLARDTHLDRDVALKIPLLRDGDAPEVRERFLREARTAARLDHPYLCQVYDYGEHHGRLFLTMAYIEGKPLSDRLTENGMPPRHVAALVGKLALALEHAHEKGVVHRDLKPANIMIKKTARGHEPVIVDFGLARGIDPGDIRMTKSGHIVGTVAYMAPEQVRGEHAAIGPACDIYALGVLMYELLTGDLPFQGNMMTVAAQILTQEPPPPSAIKPNVDPAIEAICLKAMAKRIADRHASASVVAAELTAYLKAQSQPDSSNEDRAGVPRVVGGNSGENSLVGVFSSAVIPAVVPDAGALAPLPVPAPAEARTWRRSRRIGVTAAVVALACLAGGVVLRIATNEGTLVFEGLPEDARVFVDGADVTVKVKDESVKVGVGKRGVEVQKDGIKLFGTEVELARGETRSIKVRLEKPTAQRPPTPEPALSAVRDPELVADDPEPTPLAIEREPSKVQTPAPPPTDPGTGPAWIEDGDIIRFTARSLQGWKGISFKKDWNPYEIFSPAGGELIFAGRSGGIYLDRPLRDFEFGFKYKLPDKKKSQGKQWETSNATCEVILSPDIEYRAEKWPYRLDRILMSLTSGKDHNTREPRSSGDMIPFEYGTKRKGRVAANSLMKAEHPPGQWNSARMVCQGKSIDFWLNDNKVNHLDLSNEVIGKPGLGSFGQNYSIKDIYIKNLTPQ